MPELEIVTNIQQIDDFDPGTYFFFAFALQCFGEALSVLLCPARKCIAFSTIIIDLALQQDRVILRDDCTYSVAYAGNKIFSH